MSTKSVFIPGKVLLSGEHSVVYGKPALVSSINLGVNVETHNYASVPRKDPNCASVPREDPKNLVSRAVELGGGDLGKIMVDIQSDLPIGSGLGSSAAVSAAVIKAVRLHLKKPITDSELFELTMVCERIAHGNPSGVDPAAVITGGLLWYIKGHPFERFELKKPIQLLLVNSGTPIESTGEMVEFVATQDRAVIDKMGLVTGEMKILLENGADLTEIINHNGYLLEELGVVSKKARMISQALRALGGGVKVTGAGGIKRGSGMLMVYHNELSKALLYLDRKKLDYIKVVIGG